MPAPRALRELEKLQTTPAARRQQPPPRAAVLVVSWATVSEPSSFKLADHGTFGSADDFLKSEQIHDTSCLITDVQMPGLSGLDLQDRLIARGHCIPIIFMTGYPNDNVRARAMKAGAVCFLNKPFSLDHFIGCIEKALKAA